MKFKQINCIVREIKVKILVCKNFLLASLDIIEKIVKTVFHKGMIFPDQQVTITMTTWCEESRYCRRHSDNEDLDCNSQ